MSVEFSSPLREVNCVCGVEALAISGHGLIFRTCDCAANQAIHGKLPVTWRKFANPYFGGFPWDIR